MQDGVILDDAPPTAGANPKTPEGAP
jgi:hypothetical protein